MPKRASGLPTLTGWINLIGMRGRGSKGWPEALARRGDGGAAEANTKLRLADLELDRMTRRVTRGGKKIELTAREFQLLEFMMRHSGQVVTRTMLLEGVWDYHFDPQTNVIDVHISRLRQAIDKDFEKPLLHTVRGAGYSLREDE